MAHVLPFQYSAKGTSTPELLEYHPTAVQLVVDGQDTAPRTLNPDVVLTVAWTTHPGLALAPPAHHKTAITVAVKTVKRLRMIPPAPRVLPRNSYPRVNSAGQEPCR